MILRSYCLPTPDTPLGLLVLFFLVHTTWRGVRRVKFSEKMSRKPLISTYHESRIFPVVLCHAFCTWHWPIGKNVDLSFIWGHHHLHLVDDQSTSWLLHASLLATPCYRDPKRSKQLPTVAIHGFQFGLYHVVVPLSFLRSINLASFFSSLTILADQIFYRSCVNRQHLRSFASLCYKNADRTVGVTL